MKITYRHAITRTPPTSIANGITSQNETPNAELAKQQHEKYLAALRSLDINVTVLNPEEAFPDSHFVEDTAIIHNNIAIFTRPGAKERRGEVDCIKPTIEKVLKTCAIDASEDATVDGGDILFMGNYVFIGLSYRTNLAGAEQLAKKLKEINPTLSIHNIEFDGVLHLKSGLVALNDHQLLGNPEINLKTPLPAGEIIWLPREESHAANIVVANGAALIFDKCPATYAAIEKAGLQPIPLDMSEFRKMDGSLTCLSLLW